MTKPQHLFALTCTRVKKGPRFIQRQSVILKHHCDTGWRNHIEKARGMEWVAGNLRRGCG